MGKQKKFTWRYDFCKEIGMNAFVSDDEMLGCRMPVFTVNGKCFDSVYHSNFVINSEAVRIVIYLNSRYGYDPSVSMSDYAWLISKVASKMLNETMVAMVTPKKSMV